MGTQLGEQLKSKKKNQRCWAWNEKNSRTKVLGIEDKLKKKKRQHLHCLKLYKYVKEYKTQKIFTFNKYKFIDNTEVHNSG